MAEKKRKTRSYGDAQEVFQEIKSTILRVQAALSTDRDADSNILGPLEEVSNLAEQFTAKRSKADKQWLPAALDTLDREGTNLWNTASTFHSTDESGKLNVIANLRLSGFRLIEAGFRSKPTIDGDLPSMTNVRPSLKHEITELVHILQLASKTGAVLSEVGRVDLASGVLASAAKYEESLRGAEDPENNFQQQRAQATLVYHCSRLDAAWKEGNKALASYMLQIITANDNERLVHLPAQDRAMVASKLLEVGKTLLTGDDRQGQPEEDAAADAIQWIQKAFSLIDLLDNDKVTGVAELKQSSLRNLARAYILSSNSNTAHLSRAEATIQELLSVHTHPDDLQLDDNQELRWWLVAVLERREAPNDALLRSYESIIDTMAFSEESVARVVQEAKTLNKSRQSLAVPILLHCLTRYAQWTDAQDVVLDQIVLAIIFHCDKNSDHAAAMADLNRAFTQLTDQESSLSTTGSTACLMIFWQRAHRRHRAKKLLEATDWYLLGTHAAFHNISDISSDKCHRKAALCLVEMCDYSRATVTAQRCDLNSAPTQYVLLLIAVKQGLEDEAIRAVKSMIQAPDYDDKMLLMVTRLAHEADLKTLLLSVLEELLHSLRRSGGFRAEPETVALVRCMIRLIVRLMAESASPNDALVAALLGHFQTAQELVLLAQSEKRAALVIKDISWLWRTAYNCANQGCAEWNDAEEKVPTLFDIASQLIDIYREVVVELDEEVHMAKVFSSFAATSARVFSVRHRAQQSGDFVQTNAAAVDDAFQSCQACEDLLRTVLEGSPLGEENVAVVLRCLRTVLVFQTELVVLVKRWDSLSKILEGVLGLPTDLMITLEAVVDLLWAARDCPVTVLIPALEDVLHATLDQQALSADKFARWLRAICTMLLSKNSTPERLNALNYIEQSVTVLETHTQDNEDGSQVFPVDERHWLISTSYNTGLECLHVGLLDEAKRWFEVSITICRFVPNGKAMSQKISETYSVLLERYSG